MRGGGRHRALPLRMAHLAGSNPEVVPALHCLGCDQCRGNALNRLPLNRGPGRPEVS
jgi:hypothetical protein